MDWMHSCRQVAVLLSRARDERLGTFEALRLRVHLHLCGNCRSVEQQLAEMDSMASELFAGERDIDGEGDPRAPQR